MSDLEDDGTVWDYPAAPERRGPKTADAPGWSFTVFFIILGLLGIWLLSA